MLQEMDNINAISGYYLDVSRHLPSACLEACKRLMFRKCNLSEKELNMSSVLNSVKSGISLINCTIDNSFFNLGNQSLLNLKDLCLLSNNQTFSLEDIEKTVYLKAERMMLGPITCNDFTRLGVSLCRAMFQNSNPKENTSRIAFLAFDCAYRDEYVEKFKNGFSSALSPDFGLKFEKLSCCTRCMFVTQFSIVCAYHTYDMENYTYERFEHKFRFCYAFNTTNASYLRLPLYCCQNAHTNRRNDFANHWLR